MFLPEIRTLGSSFVLEKIVQWRTACRKIAFNVRGESVKRSLVPEKNGLAFMNQFNPNSWVN